MSSTVAISRIRTWRARTCEARYFAARRIVELFDSDIRYPEKHLNAKLKEIHPDFATLRRYLVDHKLMARERNIYWRIDTKPDAADRPVYF